MNCYPDTGFSMMTEMTSLHEERLDSVYQQLKITGSRRVLDLGCGSGALLVRLVGDPQFESIVGLEASGAALALARTHLAKQPSGTTPRLRLLMGSYADYHPSLQGYDAAAMVETIEHVKPEQLSRVELAVFGQMRPRTLIMTTPNSEYNSLFGLAPGEFREEDHKFEWSRARFEQWASGVARRNGYRVRFGGIGELHREMGHPTQTATFQLQA